MANYQQNRIKNHLSAQKTQIATLEDALESNPLLRETYEAAAAALLAVQAEDVGWSPVNKFNAIEQGFELSTIQEIGEYAELQTTGNPLLNQGLRLRTAHVFGRGIKFEGEIAPRFKRVMDKPINKSALFTQDAFARNERELFNKGNLIMAYNRQTQVFWPIPFNSITNSASNPVLDHDIWYYQHTYYETNLATGETNPEPTTKWYPTLERFEMGENTIRRIQDAPVDTNIVIIDMKVNMPIGHTWGVPDCLPAMPYAWAHAEYIRDASKLLKALSTIAWKVVAKGKANAANAAAKFAGPRTGGPAQTAAMSEGTDLVAMPKAGQVDMKDGQTIASYVASALGVSLVALLSDPGAASGSYGAAATLDGPSADTARQRQDMWRTFYERIYRAAGLKDVEVNFPKLSEDPAHRQAQTLTLLRTAGALYADEYRQAALEVISLAPAHPTPPEPEEYAPAGGATAFMKFLDEQERAEEAAKAAQEAGLPGDPNARQGNTGAAGQLDEGSNELRDAERTPGTAS